MNIHVIGVSFPVTPAIEEHVRSRAILSLGPLAHRVESVTARLSDINGNHGGEDKCCRIIVSMPRSSNVVIQAVDKDLYAAIDSASARATDAVRKRVQKKNDLKRRSRVRFLNA